ncbi:sugar transferase [Ruminococcus sp. AF24-32LB]|nr:sugar transferase [Ruminococcus sp. AF24-32LB]
MYAKYLKRVIDFSLSLIALIVLSPLLLVLIVLGAVFMKGNPFFVQKRPGKNEKIISLLKFRTMTNEKDEEGKLLPDEIRLVSYGKFLRSTSLDELPSLINILIGDLSIIGPRPLLVEYLPWYTETEKHRHDVRPGLTGWAQVNGRNNVSWDRRFELDVEYVNNISFRFDLKIFLMTIQKVLKRSDIAEDTRIVEGNFADIRKKKMETEEKEC